MNTTHIMTANPYYCKFASLLKFIFNHKINACDVVAIIHRYVQNGGKGLFPDMHTASLMQSPVKEGGSLPSCFNSKCKQVSFGHLLLPRFHTFVSFAGDFSVSLFKMAPECMLKCCVLFPKIQESSDVPYRENMCVN